MLLWRSSNTSTKENMGHNEGYMLFERSSMDAFRSDEHDSVGQRSQTQIQGFETQ